MKIIDKLFGRKSTELTYDQIADLLDSGGTFKVAGVSVTRKTALQAATVLACVKSIADGCATPDLNIYRLNADKKSELATDIPEFRLLNRRPNEYQTSFEWRRMMTLHAALCGAGLSIKVKGLNGKVRELIPISPGNWKMHRVSRYEIRYRVWDEFGFIGDFTPDDVFIINGLQWDYGEAMDAVMLARNAVGLSIATEQTHAKFHENGIQASGLYSVDGTLDEKQYEVLRKYLKSKVQKGDPMILDRNASWTSLTMTGVDAQHLETRRFQIEEICRIYNVFPIMVMHSDKSATFASSEAFFSAHLKHTLQPWHKAWRDRLDETLLDGSGPLYTQFDTRYLKEGSMVDRAQWSRTMAELGIYTRNELRENEGLDPRDGLDEPLTPLNMQNQPQNQGANNEP